ncbi:hypothetical protein VdG1_00921 [Verticillium dahliae VDG1]|nr:hypothetical protein VdG1_00921 [Verticillium dahliae VDG1]
MSNDRKPVADQAEDDAWFPSPYSLTQYVAPKTDFAEGDADYAATAYKGGKWKVLLIATQERYLKMADGSFFSTGNHPVEMLLPMLHMDAAGFDIDIATLSGEPVKFEMWAFPKEDKAVQAIYDNMLAADVGKPAGSRYIYEGYKVDVFPDSLDEGANIDIGYIPGKMAWLITGEVHRDRLLLTGDSPLASNNLGKLAAKTLLEAVASK